jgi:tetratricopeptide (TPR) repeat protein
LAEQEHDELTVAAVLSELAAVARGDGDLTEALDYLHRARAIREIVGTPRAVVLCQRLIGEILAELGRFEEAAAELSSAAAAMERLHDVGQHAKALTSLGTTYVRWGRDEDAWETLRTAAALAEQVGSRDYRAEALVALGDLAIRTGRPGEAEEFLREALQIYTVSGDPKAQTVAAQLAGLTEPDG